MGVIYLIYSIIFRNKVTLYFRGVEIHEEEEEKYLKLQLYISVFNSLMAIGMGIIIIMCNINPMYLIAIPLIFHCINYGMKLIARLNGYIKP